MTSDPKITGVAVAEIVTTAGTQIRCEISESTVAEYAEALSAGDCFPPVTIFHDGSQYILADGFHRVIAATRAGRESIFADVRTGSRSDALRFALSANAAHGVRRTNADKRRSVELALAEWPKLSDRELAKVCAVGNALVGEVRNCLIQTVEQPQTRIGADGRERKVAAKKLQPAVAATPGGPNEVTNPKPEPSRLDSASPAVTPTGSGSAVSPAEYEPEEPPRVRSGPVITGDDVAIKLARLGAWRKELLVGEILEMAGAMRTYELLVSQLSTLAGEMK